jgi:pimeloyl-ACP methyl ester carboxylesterase
MCIHLILVAMPLRTLAQPGVRLPELKVKARFEGMIQVGGSKLHCRVFGEGEPTVVLIPGSGAPQTYWNGIVSAIAADSTVVTYDRAGYGKSELGTEPRSVKNIAAELNRLLGKLDIPKSYIIAGHSFGTRIARLFASDYPDTVKGVILMDHTHPDFLDAFEAELSASERDMFTQARARMATADLPGGRGAELRETATTQRELKECGPFPPVPLLVLTSPDEARISPLHKKLSPESLGKFRPMLQQYHQKVAELSPRGEHIPVEGAGHNFPLEKPEVVIDAIRRVLEMVR